MDAEHQNAPAEAPKLGMLQPAPDGRPASNCYALGDRRYFHAELVTLRKFMGLRTFWQNMERARRALGGVFYVWMNTNDPTESDGELMRSAADEFERRAMLMALA